MIAREWKTRCPNNKKEAFIKYLYETGIKETTATPGFKGAQIFIRELNGQSEVSLITYWENKKVIEAFSGENIGVAKLYPEDYKYELESDDFVTHYKVVENTWLK